MFGTSVTPDPPSASPRSQDLSTAGSPTGGDSARKRFLTSPGAEATTPHRRRRNPVKVSRACDLCKLRKSKCDGMIPCSKCVRKGRPCLYDTKYSRGRPPTPPPSASLLPPIGPSSEETDVMRESASKTPGMAVASLSRPTTEPRDLSASASPTPRPSHTAVPPERPADTKERVIPTTTAAPSRASPELDMANIEGQVSDPTSGVTFLHRAWTRLSRQHTATSPSDPSLDRLHLQQPWTLAGDKPLPQCSDECPERIAVPDRARSRALLALYFDVCIATYRFLHRETAASWLETLEWNLSVGKPAWSDIGKARAAIVLTILAIAEIHHEKSSALTAEPSSRICADELFGMASNLTETETGFPSLESAQARLIQVLYLLTTSRMNRAWYTFGNVVQIISALGLHRRPDRKRHPSSGGLDYIQSQCSMRTFWAAYILDQHLGVIFGRPRHYHDEDIDQDFPASINDEFMTPQGPLERTDDYGDAGPDCLIDALVFHAKVAQIIGQVSKEVYSITPTSEQDRAAAAHRLVAKLHDWRSTLPPHLGSIHPSSLIPSLRRQSTVLRMAYSHAVMHANRLFLLGNLSASSEPQIASCIGAARVVFETVDGLAREGPLFHAFWWTHYVTFCALLVTYVWEIQQKRRGGSLGVRLDHERLLELASRCHRHLANATATNSPSRRYAVILEEFRREAMGRVVSRHASPPPHLEGDHAGRGTVGVSDAAPMNGWDAQVSGMGGMDYTPATGYDATMADDGLQSFQMGPNLLDAWQTTDWLDLDSSAFGPYIGMGIEMSSMQWVIPQGDSLNTL
ncbi:related to C6 transcription factor [Cephalotrichum gorgonifer]|uniref:Related to C6 transcription factor n=1 Tax=Cephalotrichum gorgonifer TaxID=2041049 RepID=A0AAE8SZ53_9PEZI|nr:related to C6 transcription factor [Cephalotrichum gorgonifer]